MPRPQPQPGLTKRHDPHPATAASPAPTATGPQPAVPAARTGSMPTSGDLVPLGTRIPPTLRDDLRWLAYVTGTPIQALVIEALTAYVRDHPSPARPTA